MTEITNEIWREIPGLEGKYEVSNIGNVRKMKNKELLTPIDNGCGYLRVGQGYVHRLVGLAFIPNPENKSDINHINGVKDDNRVENLEWCTRSENIRHSIENNLRSKTKAKHGHEKVRQIFIACWEEGLNLYEAAEKFEVSLTYAYTIKNRLRGKKTTEDLVYLMN